MRQRNAPSHGGYGALRLRLNAPYLLHRENRAQSHRPDGLICRQDESPRFRPRRRRHLRAGEVHYNRRRGNGAQGSMRTDNSAKTTAKLPDGVPETNAPIQNRASFSAPDMATPSFSQAGDDAATYREVRERREVFERTTVNDDDDDDENSENSGAKSADANDDPYDAPILAGNVWSWLIGVLAVFSVIVVIASLGGQAAKPLCADQPSWNQYNCRTE